MPISLLAEEVASQIAAGEVIERPASVVKELLENALDAHASQVIIRIEQAGQRLIEIADDGEGIPAEEMHLAVARHATSKLHSAEDLFHIQTLGFRGEALASMASVSRLTLISRHQESSIGSRMVVEGGQIRSINPVGVPPGTVVRIEDLFYNVPARLKFLKKDGTERQQISALVTRYALAYSQVRFNLAQEELTAFQTSGNGDRRQVLIGLYGLEVGRQMLEIKLEDEGFQVEGFISPLSLTRSNRREMTFFVNGRWVQDTSLISAVLQAYRTLLMVGRYPMAVLFIHIPPEQVDVNVHPAKAEVRFRNPDKIFSLVQRAVRRGLLAYSPVPQVSMGWKNHSNTQASSSARMIDPAWEMSAQTQVPAISGNATPETDQHDTASLSQNSMSTNRLPAESLPLLRLVGQVGGTYIVAEGPDGIYLVDQHAAHERVLFERWMGALTAPIASQALLEPVLLHLPPQNAQVLSESLEILQHLGFDVEPFGQNIFRVRSIPSFLTGLDPVSALRVVVEDFEEDETPLQTERQARLAARICKRAAVKGGQNLSIEEQRVLLRDLEKCHSPRTCPHGRPTMIHLSVDLLERQFGRRG